MGRRRGSSADTKSLFSMSRKDQINFLKGHHLLRTCNSDKMETLPKVGELVWARVLGAVFWPGFILELKDIEVPDLEDGADEIDETSYGFVMFLEKTYRYAPVAWDQMIPFQDIEAQMVLVPEYNRLVVKKTWKPTTLFRTSMEMAKEYSKMTVVERLETALARYETIKKTQALSKSSSGSSLPSSPTKPELPPTVALNKLMSTNQEKRKSGIRVSDRITTKQMVKLTHKQELETATPKKTERTSDEKAATNNKVNKNSRPETGGEVLKQWTRQRFDSFLKQYTFESSNVQCGKCDKEIDAEESAKTCHGVPYHSKCLIQDGNNSPAMKCKMCINQECFLCRKPSEKTEPAFKCSKCDLRFHIECLSKDWPQAEIQGSNGPITCPLHFCHTCLGEQKIFGKCRDYTTNSSRSFKCRLCLSTYHKACLPAGCGESVQGKEFVVCPRHTLPELKVHQRRIGCLTCYKPVKPKEEKVECSYCIQTFHPECLGYTGEIRNDVSLEVFGQDYKCFSCKWGLFPLYGQTVWFQQPQHQYWPARILFPGEHKARKAFAKRLPGQYSIEYFGSTLYYDNASRAIPLHLTTMDIFKSMKVYQEVPKILRAHEEAGFCYTFTDEYRDKLLPTPKPVYKKIEKNVYRTVNIQKVREPSDVCSCSEESGESVCQTDSGCTNRDMEMECSDRICNGGSRCSNRMFSERKNDDDFLQQKLFPKKGWGVIAMKAFKPGDFVAEYRGEIIDRNEMKWRLNKKEEEDPMYILEISKEYFIDAEYVGNLSRLINHSCDPNCEVRKYLSLGKSVGGIFARRSINVGDEVTFKYGCGSQSTAPFRCRCGARNCTVFVGKDVPDNFMLEDETELSQDKWDDVCSKCNFGGRVICCEFPACGKVWHYQCVGLSRQPRKNWCCPEHPLKKVAQLKKASETRNKLNKSKLVNGRSHSHSGTPASARKSPAQSQPMGRKKAARLTPSTPPPMADLEEDAGKSNPHSSSPAVAEKSLAPSQPVGKKKASRPTPPSPPAVAEMKAEIDLDLEVVEAASKPQKRKLSSTVVPSEVAPQPAQKKQRLTSISTKSDDDISNFVEFKFVPDPNLKTYGRSLRSCRAMSSAKSTMTSLEPPCSPTLSMKSEAMLVMRKTLDISSMLPSTQIKLQDRRRRANSIPANGFSFSVPSTPNTRSKRRGESINERTPFSRRHDATARVLSLEASPISDIITYRRASNEISCSDLGIPRASRRIRGNKVTEPFSPLALNPYIRPRELPPVHLSNVLNSSEKLVRMGTRLTRSSPGTFPESPSFNHDATSNGLFSNGMDSSGVSFEEIKKDLYNGFEGDSYRLNISLEQTRNKRSRLGFDAASDAGSTISSHSSSFEFEVPKSSGLEILFQKPKTYQRIPRQYSEKSFPL